MHFIFFLLSWISFGVAENCLPISEAIGLQNAEGIPPINCEITATKKTITCYPSARVVFPTLQEITCLPTDVEPFISSPISVSDGPSNFYEMAPIKCKKDNTVVECYPNRKITFPVEFVELILCFPVPPEPIQTTTTELITTQDMTPQTCLPVAKYLGGNPNDQFVFPILCQLMDNITVINCYPPTQLWFPLENPEYVTCTPMPRVPVLCEAVAPIDGAPKNADGIPPILCKTLGDNVTLSCYTNNEATVFPDPTYTYNCLSLYQ